MNIFAFLNSYTEGLSGGDACFINNAKYLNRKDNLTIVTSALGKILCQNNRIRANYLITSQEKRFSNVMFTYFIRTLKTLLINIPLDNSILYSSSDFLPDVLAPYIQKIFHKKHIWVQKIFHLIPKNRVIPSLFQRLCFLFIKSADIIIVDNAKLKSDLENNYGLSSGKIFVIPPGVDISYFKKIKKEKKKYDAIFIGQLRESKGIFDIPNIWGNVVKKYPHAKLAIIGKNIGDNQSMLEGKIKEKSLSKNIDLLGFLSTDKTFSLLKSAKCFILPSYEEGFGMVILESLACGTPIVTYDLPVFREYFSGGINVVSVGNTKKFSDKVIDTIGLNRRTNYLDIYNKFDINKLVIKEYRLIKNIYEKKTTS